MTAKFRPDVLRSVRRIHRALSHHDATLRALIASEPTALEREVYRILEHRLRRLQYETLCVETDRATLAQLFERAGIDFRKPDAAIGRALRRIVGEPRSDRIDNDK